MSEIPQTISRKQTIIIEASQKQSISKTNDDYETILTNGVEINNGDLVQIGGVYCDTTNIDPSKIRIEEDVNVEYHNGMYLINQQLETVVPSSKRTDRAFITDNLPYTFCQFNEGSTSSLTHYKTGRVQAGPLTPVFWGNISFPIEYMDSGHNVLRKEISLPQYSFPTSETEHDYDIDIVGLTSYGIKPINPDTGNESYDWGTGLTSAGGIHNPLVSQTSVGVDGGLFHPVINKGGFTIKAGDYSPDYIAKVLTDGFSKLNPDNLRNKIVQPTGTQYFDAVGGSMTNFPTTAPPEATSYGQIVLDPDAFLSLPFTNQQKYDGAYDGWSMVCEFLVSNTPADVYKTETLTIIASPDDYTFRGQDSNGHGWPQLEMAGASYPTDGGLRVGIIPPPDYIGTGSNFLQTTSNYTTRNVEGSKRYAFVDCTQKNPNNILTFEDDRNMPFGTTQMEVAWDPDLERMKFDYIHFPFSGTDGTGPTLIKQMNWVYNAQNNSYVNDYNDGSVNQISASYSGIFFSMLEPREFFETLLGFDYSDRSIIVAPQYDTTITNSYTDGRPTNGGNPQPYAGVTAPVIDLIYGQNITRQTVTISDVIGTPENYTTYEAIGATTPLKLDGRVLVDKTQVDSIIATTKGSQIGVQDSGYYIVEIEIGMMYNINIGSSTQPKSFTRNIRAIVDRYYTVKSYTSSAGSNTEYIHYGNSTIIKSVKVRLRNSDGTIIKHLGDDNTVFLNIIKNNIVEITPPLKS